MLSPWGSLPSTIIIPRSPFAQMPLRGLSPLCLPESQPCSQQLSVGSICQDVTSHAHDAEALAHTHDEHEGVVVVVDHYGQGSIIHNLHHCRSLILLAAQKYRFLIIHSNFYAETPSIWTQLCQPILHLINCSVRFSAKTSMCNHLISDNWFTSSQHNICHCMRCQPCMPISPW